MDTSHTQNETQDVKLCRENQRGQEAVRYMCRLQMRRERRLGCVNSPITQPNPHLESHVCSYD